MTSGRARAYARVTMTLDNLGPAKLLGSEQAQVRHVADTLLFCADLPKRCVGARRVRRRRGAARAPGRLRPLEPGSAPAASATTSGPAGPGPTPSISWPHESRTERARRRANPPGRAVRRVAVRGGRRHVGTRRVALRGRAMTRPPPTPPTERPWIVRPRRPGCSSCASRPPEPDLDHEARSVHHRMAASRSGLCATQHPTLEPAAGAKRRPPLSAAGRNAARAPGAGARAASGGCGQGERADRPLVSRWKETRGTGLGADHRIPAAEELAREIDAALERLGAGGNAMKRMEGLTRRCLLAWP